jgi:polyisoprenoid-binding protein YceI
VTLLLEENVMATWNIDPDHSAAEFVIGHMMVTPVHGQCNKVSGILMFDPADPINATVEVTVDVASIYTGVERRDNHLRSADFFDVENYPTMHFKSTGVEVVGLNHCKVAGDLTIHGITRPVICDVTFTGPSRFFDDDEHRMYTTFGFHAATCINREDFGLTWNLPIQDGGFMLGKHVDIVLSAEADLINE